MSLVQFGVAFGACLAMALPALAQETEPPAPWVQLNGAHRGAVGTCSTDDADNPVCYMVRCDKKSGLVFEISDPTLGDMGLRSARFEIGRFKQTVKLSPSRSDTRSLVLSAQPRFLTALTSGARFATMVSVDADVAYSTGFDLQDAPAKIRAVQDRCQAPR